MADPRAQSMIAALIEEQRGYLNRKRGAEEAAKKATTVEEKAAANELAGKMAARAAEANAALRRFGVEGAAPVKRAEKRIKKAE